MVKPTTPRKANEYEDSDGRSPFGEWLTALKDVRGKVKITKAITQMEGGNFGDHKAITGGSGLYERRIDFGPGYRIYYIIEGDKLIIIFAGSEKKDQQQAIDNAKDYYADYKKRKKEESDSAAKGKQSRPKKGK
ncbi:type II toxin-antitoxin system RelE/ParE family toxin [Photobacterium sp. SP02]|uniref:type II toxin-antitoxin system RelE/ParE family toxin n=1 Tax=Photobacterium sp. SP02 TaxID=3032280 RepID=UPI003144FAF2